MPKGHFNDAAHHLPFTSYLGDGSNNPATASISLVRGLRSDIVAAINAAYGLELRLGANKHEVRR